MQVPAVGVHLIGGSAAVGVDAVDHPLSQPGQLLRPEGVGVRGQQPLPRIQVGRVEPATVDLGQRPLDQMHLLGTYLPGPLREASTGRRGARGSPSMLTRSPTAAAARTRRAASPGDSRSAATST